MTADADRTSQSRLSRGDKRVILVSVTVGLLACAGALGVARLVYNHEMAAAEKARSAMAVVLTLNNGFAYSGGIERVGAQGSQLAEEPYALFLMDPQGPEGMALQRGLSWRACDTMAIVLDAAHDRSGGACVPESREDEVWDDFATLLRG